MPRPRPRQSGFTLLEVLVAAAIVALLAASLGAAMHIAFRARRSATEGLDTARAARLAMEAVGRDLRTAARPTGILQGPFIATDATLEAGRSGDSVLFSCAAGPLRPAAGVGDIVQVTLMLVRASELQTAPAGATSSGSASGNNGSNGTAASGRDATGAVLPPAAVAGDSYVLVRRENRRQLATVADTPYDQVICRGVRSFNLRYYDGTNWGDVWDSTAQVNVLPLAVEVTLAVDPADADAGASPVVLTRVFSLPCAELATETGQ
ncbi:MAG: prepilin-type N-terminal cleavage/methylation domain-containing protein [Planctomycetota bacterium]|nr:prepilin-type N-terminal cleavage/methylation domain-containing protein [Planctomycetota bacterium]